MKNLFKVSVFVLIIVLLSGCATHTHIVGKGAQTGFTQEARQWYVLWGLVPINNIDTNEMAGDVPDYTIKTEQNAIDVIVNIVTSWFTVYSRTVTVTK